MSSHTIDDALWEEAEKLADRPYRVVTSSEALQNGEKIVFVENPEIAGCMAQGATLGDALYELRQARISQIYYLMVDGLQVERV